jgi:hypothetical protein
LVEVSEVEAERVRAARNQSFFREVNEQVQELNETFDQLERYGSWTCECADIKCVEPIELTLPEYEAIRGHPNRFAVLPDAAHVYPQVELLVEQGDRYWTVEKFGEAGQAAIELDPRGR